MQTCSNSQREGELGKVPFGYILLFVQNITIYAYIDLYRNVV